MRAQAVSAAMQPKTLRHFAMMLVVLLAALVTVGDAGAAAPAPSGTVSVDDDARIAAAFRERRSDVAVETGGQVIKLLPDDNQGSRHQRFIIRLNSGQTVLVSHNIDLAPRIDGLRTGDRVDVRGEYEWNARGGVIHWTHHDPQGRHPGGWLRHRGRLYQ